MKISPVHLCHEVRRDCIGPTKSLVLQKEERLTYCGIIQIVYLLFRSPKSTVICHPRFITISLVYSRVQGTLICIHHLYLEL